MVSIHKQNEPTFGSTSNVFPATKTAKIHKRMSDCCYSISNLALIVSAVIALVFLIRFTQDDPLYEYGEHLLTLRFYRQLIYTIVVMPLVLLVPLFNTASAFFLSNRTKLELAHPILVLKVIYQVLMLVLVFIALIFIAPSIRTNVLASQIELELRKHMQHRYDNNFSYEFLDRLQEEYECCDELWYRSNMHDRVPMSCFRTNGLFDEIYDESCSDAIGSLVSTRCSFISTGLIVILIALIFLIAIDILEIATLSNNQYDVSVPRDDPPTNSSIDGGHGDDDLRSTTIGRANGHSHESDSGGSVSSEQARNRLHLHDREREVPLLSKQTTPKLPPSPSSNRARRIPEGSTENSGIDSCSLKQASPILTRASYHDIDKRSKSPVFLDKKSYDLDSTAATLPRSSMKKTSSFQSIDSDEELVGDYAERLRSNLQRQRQKEQQTSRRHLLNVRFAE